MRRRRDLLTTAMLAGTAVVLAAACGGDGAAAGPGQMVETGITAIDDAGALACGADRDVLQQAVDAYTMLEGEPPASESALVPDYLREESELWDLDAAGGVVASPTSTC